MDIGIGQATSVSTNLYTMATEISNIIDYNFSTNASQLNLKHMIRKPLSPDNPKRTVTRTRDRRSTPLEPDSRLNQKQVHPPCEALGQWHTPCQSCRQGSWASTASPSCHSFPKQSTWLSSISCSSSQSTSFHICPCVSFLGPEITWQCFRPESEFNDH